MLEHRSVTKCDGEVQKSVVMTDNLCVVPQAWWRIAEQDGVNVKQCMEQCGSKCGARWSKVEQGGARWSKVEQGGARWRSAEMWRSLEQLVFESPVFWLFDPFFEL